MYGTIFVMLTVPSVDQFHQISHIHSEQKKNLHLIQFYFLVIINIDREKKSEDAWNFFLTVLKQFKIIV